tara:strand:+ start:490 stop:666 length:177 start_codon:yes stop_codon:yes gene_type:complete
MKVGDLVKVEGGTLRPPWYGETGVIVALQTKDWYVVALTTSSTRVICNDMLELISESR